MTSRDRAAIGATVDRFVRDVLLRRNLADGWDLAGPQLRGGTTRDAWTRGRGVTVEAFPARGRDFSRSWTGQLANTHEAVLSVILRPRPKANAFETAFAVDLLKVRGRWVVNGFYPAATIRGKKHQGSCGLAKCGISGPADFGALADAGGGGGSAKGRIGANSFAIAMVALGVLVVSAPLGIWMRVRRRNRRALAAYRETLDG